MRNNKEIEKVNINIVGEKIMRVAKILILIALLVLTYFISDKVVDYLFSLEIEIVKRGLNIILAAIIVLVYKK